MSGLRYAILVALAAASSAALAQIYRWTDEKGRVHITDTPPPPSAKSIQKREMPASSASPMQPSEPYALQEARKKAPVTLYSIPGCVACNAARQLLNARGVPFREVSVVDEQKRDELLKAVGADAVPSLVVGTAVQQGFQGSAYHAMLDAAGYPLPGVLPPRSQEEPKPAAAESEAPVTQAEEARPLGPYAPGAPRQRPQKK